MVDRGNEETPSEVSKSVQDCATCMPIRQMHLVGRSRSLHMVLGNAIIRLIKITTRQNNNIQQHYNIEHKTQHHK